MATLKSCTLQVGTVIVNYEKILSRGHNRMPDGCESLPWDDNEQNLYTSKYPYGKNLALLLKKSPSPSICNQYLFLHSFS